MSDWRKGRLLPEKAIAEKEKHEKPIAMVLDVLLFLFDLTLSSQDD